MIQLTNTGREELLAVNAGKKELSAVNTGKKELLAMIEDHQKQLDRISAKHGGKNSFRMGRQAEINSFREAVESITTEETDDLDRAFADFLERKDTEVSGGWSEEDLYELAEYIYAIRPYRASLVSPGTALSLKWLIQLAKRGAETEDEMNLIWEAERWIERRIEESGER